MHRMLFLLLILSSSHALAQSGLYLELQLGYTDNSTDLSVEQGNIDLNFTPEDSGTLMGGLVGYRINERWFVNAGYQQTDASDTKIDYTTASANYRFWISPSDWSAYAGVVGGRSELKWQDDPVEALYREQKSEQNFFGGQLAIERRFMESWQATLRYQYLDLEHTTKLETFSGEGRFTHKNFSIVSAGVRYNF